MNSPFITEENVLISFSGGRTSGLMLKMFIDANDGTLPENYKVIFANTGKEHPNTLKFVNDCAVNWGIDIVWLEFKCDEGDKPKQRWKEVTYGTASRNGQPFADLIKMRSYLPNPVTRFCTIDMKIRPIQFYCEQVLGWTEWNVAIGFRADEMRRVKKLANNKEKFERFAPLAQISITKREVSEFWKAQPFDLELPNNNGNTDHGNCDLCFLKGERKRIGLIAENPAMADWWIEQEIKVGATFRKDGPNYQRLKQFAIKQVDFFGYEREDLADCFCAD